MHDTPSSLIPVSIGAAVHVGGPPAGVSLVSAWPFLSTIAQSPVAEQDTFSGAPLGSSGVEDHVGGLAEALPVANTLPLASVATHTAELAQAMLVSDALVTFVLAVHGKVAGVLDVSTLPEAST